MLHWTKNTENTDKFNIKWPCLLSPIFLKKESLGPGVCTRPGIGTDKRVKNGSVDKIQKELSQDDPN